MTKRDISTKRNIKIHSYNEEHTLYNTEHFWGVKVDYKSRILVLGLGPKPRGQRAITLLQ